MQQVLLVCAVVATLIGVVASQVSSCFMCQIGDGRCNDDQFVKNENLLTSCRANACYTITATRPGGGSFNGRGCESTNGEAGHCIDYSDGMYIGKKCFCTKEQCNAATPNVGRVEFYRIAGLAATSGLVIMMARRAAA